MSDGRCTAAPLLAAALAAVLAAGALTACDRPAEEPDEPIRPTWQEVSLPLPPGAAGRPMPRDATSCRGRWYAVGAVGAAADATVPAAWTSTDGRSWTALTVRPKTFYGRQNVIYSAACRDGRLAAIGGKVGGAHGNPRVSSWRQLPDGSLDEVIAGFELYGGPYAVNVWRMAAGPAGWLIVGNRMTGAAVWTSPDSAEFAIVEGAPGLASDGSGETWGFDAVATGRGWLTVGALTRPGRSDADPLAWTSADGRSWTRQQVPATGEYEELQRVVLAADGTPVAVGLRGRAFGGWRWASDGWAAAARFGAVPPNKIPAVRGLAVSGNGLVATVSDGVAHTLWHSADGGRSWRTVRAPAALPAGADRAATAAVGPGGVLLLGDDATAGRAWLAADINA